MINTGHLPGGTVLVGLGRWAGRGVGPILTVVLVGVVLIGAAMLARGVQGKPRVSGYVPGRNEVASLAVVRDPGGAAPAVRPPAAAPAGALRVVANPNYGTVPAAVDANSPYGPPVARTDWIITKDYAAHGGHSNTGAVDFAIVHDYQALGSALVATHAGRVKLLHDDPTYGNLVYVMGPHYTTTYGHMQKFAVADGDQVVRGTVLGEMGSTGHSTGPHVDYQVWRDGANLDPMDYGIPGAQGAGPAH